MRYLIAIMLLVVSVSFGQERTSTGIVKDSIKAIPKANIVVKPSIVTQTVSVSSIPKTEYITIRCHTPSVIIDPPLYVVDGVPMEYEDFQKLGVETIESMSIKSGIGCNPRKVVLVRTNQKLMDGSYRIEFNNKLNDMLIRFNGETAIITDTNFTTYGSVVDYGYSISVISESNPDIIIDFKWTDMENDVINFKVRPKNQGLTYWDNSLNRGKLIKIQ